MKKFSIIILILVLSFSFISCGSNSNEAYNNGEAISADYDMAVDSDDSFGGVTGSSKNIEFSESEEMEPLTDASTGSNNTYTQAERKIIQSAGMDVETLEFDKAVKMLKDKINNVGGYIESSSVQGKSIDDHYSTRYASFVLRIPKDSFLLFMSDMNTIGNVINESTYGEDITSQYYDTEAHLKTLEVQEERLLDILRKAEKIEDIISLERELTNVRYQIESLQGSMKRWDNLVSYATLHLSLREVIEITEKVETPKTLGEKISARFSRSVEGIKDFFEDLTIFGIGSLPYLIIYIPVILVLVLVLRRALKKARKKNEVIVEEKEQK